MPNQQKSHVEAVCSVKNTDGISEILLLSNRMMPDMLPIYREFVATFK